MIWAGLILGQIDLGQWAYRPERPLAGAANGPLANLTFSAKDLYGVPGWPLRASSGARLPEVAPSPLITKLLALGATLTGTTHLHEIALGHQRRQSAGAGPQPA